MLIPIYYNPRTGETRVPESWSKDCVEHAEFAGRMLFIAFVGSLLMFVIGLIGLLF